jgi:hypothetical protein
MSAKWDKLCNDYPYLLEKFEDIPYQAWANVSEDRSLRYDQIAQICGFDLQLAEFAFRYLNLKK